MEEEVGGVEPAVEPGPAQAAADAEPLPESTPLRAAFVAYARGGPDYRAPPPGYPGAPPPGLGAEPSSATLNGMPSTTALDGGLTSGPGLGLSGWMRLCSDLGIAESQGGPLAGSVLQTLHQAYRPHNAKALPYLGFLQAIAALSSQLRTSLLPAVASHGEALAAQQRHAWRSAQLTSLQATAITAVSAGAGTSAAARAATARALRCSWNGALPADAPAGGAAAADAAAVFLIGPELSRESAIITELWDTLEQQRQQQPEAAALMTWVPREAPPPPPPIVLTADFGAPAAQGPQGANAGDAGDAGSAAPALPAVGRPAGGRGRGSPGRGGAANGSGGGGGGSALPPPQLPQQRGNWVAAQPAPQQPPAQQGPTNPYLQGVQRSKQWAPQLKPLRSGAASEPDLKAYNAGPPYNNTGGAAGGGGGGGDVDPDSASSPLTGGTLHRVEQRQTGAGFPMGPGGGGGGGGNLTHRSSVESATVRLPAVNAAARLGGAAAGGGGPEAWGRAGSPLRQTGPLASSSAAAAAPVRSPGTNLSSRPVTGLKSLGAEGGGGGGADVSGLVVALLGRIDRLERAAAAAASKLEVVGGRVAGLEAGGVAAAAAAAAPVAAAPCRDARAVSEQLRGEMAAMAKVRLVCRT